MHVLLPYKIYFYARINFKDFSIFMHVLIAHKRNQSSELKKEIKSLRSEIDHWKIMYTDLGALIRAQLFL